MLKLIEGSGDGKSSFFHKTRLARRRLKFFSWDAIKGTFSFFRGSFSGGFKREWSWKDLKNINQVLTLGIFFLFLFSGIRLYFSISQARVAGDIDRVAKIESEALLPPPARPLSSYLEKVRSRNIFAMVEAPAMIETKDPREAVLAEEIEEVRRRYSLVGISWSEDPDVLIEDSKAGKTFFLKRGQALGETKVQAIFRDRVILEYKGAEVELK